ncbi:LOW QUALITY PROTEIN: hypothetical protein PHMEG_00020275 [Phytophthora megakarya]|uniref:Uncharacterized protein n=1 Tax=Phytophthora megakarya TaxID=4795 RepID=A0A225VPT8_9STRA|nr:LOW QUALITY PROTEIN: hypothetical protein PHMEG_00020275 [Phytophthora megakarya]
MTLRYTQEAKKFRRASSSEVETIKDRLDLSLDEIKCQYHSYRKKSGVSEDYTELKRILQDNSNRIRDV